MSKSLVFHCTWADWNETSERIESRLIFQLIFQLIFSLLRLIFLHPIIGYYLKRWSSIPWAWAAANPRLSNWDLTVRCQAWQAGVFCQSKCADPALKQHEYPVLMLLFGLIFLLLRLLYISEQLAGGPYLNFCAANHCMMITRDQVNIRPMSTA